MKLLMHEMKVLVVDDDRAQLSAIRAWLESEVSKVVTHDSPFGTARLVAREKPDIVLLDVSMPGLDGGQLAGMLQTKGQAQGAAIIFYSGQDRTKLDALAQEHGIQGAIPKTETGRAFLVEFRRLVERWMARSEKLRQASRG